jgi:hypothetical protein
MPDHARDGVTAGCAYGTALVCAAFSTRPAKPHVPGATSVGYVRLEQAEYREPRLAAAAVPAPERAERPRRHR